MGGRGSPLSFSGECAAVRRSKCLVLVTVLCVVASAKAQQPVPSHKTTSPQQSSPKTEPPVVVTVNGVELLADRLAAAMNELMPYGAYHVGASDERRAVLRKQALDKLVDEELQFQEATRLGLVAARVEVDKEYARVRRHYKTEEEFVTALKRAGSSKTEVRAEARRRSLIRQAADRAVASECRITEAEARQYYDANTTKFRMPDQLHVFTLTLGVEPSAPREQWDATRKKAEELLAQARGGADFAALARQHSTDPNKAKGGDLGFVHRGRLAEEFEKALADAKPGALVGPVETIYGFHLLRVTAVRPPVQRTFAEVRTGLLKDLRQKRCAEAREAWLSRLRQRAEIVFADSGSQGPDGAIPKSPGR